MKAITRVSLAGALLCSAASLAPVHALAAEATGGADAVTVEEVTITARKREEKALDVPATVTVIGGTTLADRGVTNLSDAQELVPGLRIVEDGVGGQRIQLRGISQYLGLPTVGLYVDEVSVSGGGASSGLDVKLYDMDRIEVLHGPQPGLYGEGSMGGTIRYVTANPNLSTFSARIAGELGAVTDGGTATNIQGMVNIPIAEGKAGLRLVAGRDDTGGWIDGLEKDGNQLITTTVRGKLLLKPTDAFTASLLVQHETADQDYYNFTSPGRVSSVHVPTPFSADYTLANLVLTYDFGPVTLLSTTGYFDTDRTATYDYTDALAPFFGFFGLPSNTVAGAPGSASSTTKSQEFRLSSNGDGPFRYLVGALYSDYDLDGVSSVYSVPAFPWGLLGLNSTYSQSSKSWAIFANAAYTLDRWEFEVEGRYFHDKRATASVSALGANAAEGSFNSFNPRVSVKYHIGDGIIFANAAKGFRSGGFNQIQPNVPLTFDPEKLWSYEAGFKQEFYDRRLLVEASVYYNKYDNLQAIFPIYDKNGIFIAQATTNQGKASGPGADLNVAFKATPRLTLTSTIGYTHVTADVDSANRFKGDPLDNVPPWTALFAADYRRPLGGDRIVKAHIDWAYTQKAVIILRNYAPNAYSESRGVLNGRVAYGMGPYEVYVFANNITDEDKIVRAAFGGYPEPAMTRPRIVGVGFSARF